MITTSISGDDEDIEDNYDEDDATAVTLDYRDMMTDSPIWAAIEAMAMSLPGSELNQSMKSYVFKVHSEVRSQNFSMQLETSD